MDGRITLLVLVKECSYYNIHYILHTRAKRGTFSGVWMEDYWGILGLVRDLLPIS